MKCDADFFPPVLVALLIVVLSCTDTPTAPAPVTPTGCCMVTWYPRALGVDTLAWIPCAQTAFPGVTTLARIPCSCDSIPTHLLRTH
jgi:hypothetical protein